jgi:arsenite-transporting ATPase
VRNLIAMNEILRDRENVSIRLVMNPDRMVIDEARRTFTYLNLYGYLTDAVVVNRVFPAEVGDYFGAWRELQQEHLREVEAAFAPVPILTAPYFPAEVIGPDMLDRLGDELFDGHDARSVLHASLAHELDVSADGATIRLDLPLSEKGDISLKKIGLELVVRVNGHKRTLLLPPALAGYRPAEASFVDGALEVAFQPPDDVAEPMVAVDG